MAKFVMIAKGKQKGGLRLSLLDFSPFEPARFAFEKKAERTDMRVPKPLLDALKERASHRSTPYTRFIREIMEREISRPERPAARAPQLLAFNGRSGVLRRGAESLKKEVPP